MTFDWSRASVLLCIGPVQSSPVSRAARSTSRWATHMDASGRKRWVRVVILLGGVYFVVGIAFAAFAGWSASNQMRTAWRLAAWVISAVAFATHVGYERLRLRNSALTTALRTSMAVAVGAFALAVAANVHAQR